jgi:hypothetical protein
VLYFGAVLAIIVSVEYAAIHTAVHAALNLSE